jgi:hypothetical protein
MPPDTIDVNQSLLLIGELMARYLTYGIMNIDKLFLNRLYNCLIIYQSSIIFDKLLKIVLQNNMDLLFMYNNMIKSTLDVHIFDQADIPLEYIPLVHDISIAASGSWTIKPTIPSLIYFYCSDKGREYISRDGAPGDPSLSRII